MDDSILGKLFLCKNYYAKSTINYLQEIGFDYDIFKKTKVENYTRLENEFTIEFYEKPSIIKTLEYIGAYDKDNPIPIDSISKNGVAFYICGRYIIGDGNIFVPMSNIKSIHSVFREQINGDMFNRDSDI